jgi:tripeptidyl-peptidase I
MFIRSLTLWAALLYYIRQICNNYMALGARGVSVIFGSGDGGVRGIQDDGSRCTNNTFIPTFPSVCPYVTSVGGTFDIGANERATNFTTGGFSNLFPRPAYQDAVVSSYLSNSLPSDFAGDFNRSGRAFPDVAFQSLNFAIVVGGVDQTIWGTSCSGPGMASVIAFVNDRLINAGKGRMGFLNPWLYSQEVVESGAFKDITKGKNAGFVCNETAVCGPSSFS